MSSCWTDISYCKRFLRAGGTISLEVWIQLDPEEQVALALAGDELATERALQLVDGLVDRNSLVDELNPDAPVYRELIGIMDRMK
jgi:hypothetical protein